MPDHFSSVCKEIFIKELLDYQSAIYEKDVKKDDKVIGNFHCKYNHDNMAAVGFRGDAGICSLCITYRLNTDESLYNMPDADASAA